MGSLQRRGALLPRAEFQPASKCPPAAVFGGSIGAPRHVILDLWPPQPRLWPTSSAARCRKSTRSRRKMLTNSWIPPTGRDSISSTCARPTSTPWATFPGARSYPRGFLEVRADKHHHKRDPWLEDRHRKLILYCGGGNRSALAAQTLQQMGFKHVYSLREGWSGWDDRGFRVEK